MWPLKNYKLMLCLLFTLPNPSAVGLKTRLEAGKFDLDNIGYTNRLYRNTVLKATGVGAVGVAHAGLM